MVASKTKKIITKKKRKVRSKPVTLPKTKTKWTGIKPNPHDHFGFIYLVTNVVTGQMYVGKKQFWRAKSIEGCKSKVTDRASPKWKPCCWVESDWQSYKGSSKHLTKDIKDLGVSKFTFEILRLCRSRGVLYYSEIEEQVFRGVMWKRLGDEYLFYNRQIASCKFMLPDYYKGREA
jgi:hypothetical protein